MMASYIIQHCSDQQTRTDVLTLRHFIEGRRRLQIFRFFRPHRTLLTPTSRLLIFYPCQIFNYIFDPNDVIFNFLVYKVSNIFVFLVLLSLYTLDYTVIQGNYGIFRDQIYPGKFKFPTPPFIRTSSQGRSIMGRNEMTSENWPLFKKIQKRD